MQPIAFTCHIARDDTGVERIGFTALADAFGIKR